MKRYLLLVFLLFSFFGIAQHQDKVDFTHADVSIEPIPLEKRINGQAVYQFEVLQPVDSVFLDAKNIEFNSISLNGEPIKYSNNGKTISIQKHFKKGEKHQLALKYTCTPKQTVYFLGWDDEIKGNEQIWTQGQGKYTSHWLPSFDDMEEKVEFDVLIKTHKNKIAIANGENIIEPLVKNDSIKWHFNMEDPMSSYLIAFAIGNYNKQELTSKSGIPIENYYYPQDSLKVEPTYRHTKEIFEFLESEIGVDYPWQNYKQIPVRDFLYAGMENTTATIFSDGYMIDSTAFIDKNYVNVNAHELAHQWFGNLVTEKNGNHHWLQEGFATYYAQLAEKAVFGDDHYYWKLFNTMKDLQKLAEDNAGQALTDPKASSATFYEKGAWALVMLKEQIGEKAFKKGIKSYLKKYKFTNVTIEDFLNEMRKASGLDLENYKSEWLVATEFQIEEAKTFLMKHSSSIRMFYVSKHGGALSWINEEEPAGYKLALLDEFKKDISPIDLLLAAEKLNIKVRQKVIQIVDITADDSAYLEIIQPVLERYLVDESYITIENTLFKLWSLYPEEKGKYLEQTKAIIGLPNKNVRLLWLTLAIVSNDYDARNTKVYFQELSGYTAAEFGWEIRIGAFRYLHQTLGLNTESLKNLIQATVHHSWQFKKFARNLVEELLKDADYEVRLQEIAKELKGEELRYINTKLNK